MATKKVYPFIHAKMFDLGDIDRQDVVFDAREVESYAFWVDVEEDDPSVEVYFKSGNHILLELGLDQKVYPGDNLITAIERVQHTHYWHDNEDSIPYGDEK